MIKKAALRGRGTAGVSFRRSFVRAETICSSTQLLPKARGRGRVAIGGGWRGEGSRTRIGASAAKQIGNLTRDRHSDEMPNARSAITAETGGAHARPRWSDRRHCAALHVVGRAPHAVRGGGCRARPRPRDAAGDRAADGLRRRRRRPDAEGHQVAPPKVPHRDPEATAGGPRQRRRPRPAEPVGGGGGVRTTRR